MQSIFRAARTICSNGAMIRIRFRRNFFSISTSARMPPLLLSTTKRHRNQKSRQRNVSSPVGKDLLELGIAQLRFRQLCCGECDCECACTSLHSVAGAAWRTKSHEDVQWARSSSLSTHSSLYSTPGSLQGAHVTVSFPPCRWCPHEGGEKITRTV